MKQLTMWRSLLFGTYTLDSFREEFEAGRFVNGKKFSISELLNRSSLSNAIVIEADLETCLVRNTFRRSRVFIPE